MYHHTIILWMFGLKKVNDEVISHVVQSSLDEAKDAHSNGTKQRGAHV